MMVHPLRWISIVLLASSLTHAGSVIRLVDEPSRPTARLSSRLIEIGPDASKDPFKAVTRVIGMVEDSGSSADLAFVGESFRERFAGRLRGDEIEVFLNPISGSQSPKGLVVRWVDRTSTTDRSAILEVVTSEESQEGEVADLIWFADESMIAGLLPESDPGDLFVVQLVGKSIDLEQLGIRLKKAITAGQMTERDAIATYKRAAGKINGHRGREKKSDAMMMKPKAMAGGPSTFYAIVIGRLRSKDLEFGEFTIEVDYVTSIYGDRRIKDELIGETITVVGVSGAWLDSLLLIKPGETLKFRSGTVQGTTVSLSPKATVLERAIPFDPEVYPVPPETFRGFRGIVIGTITNRSETGYELTIRVDEVEQTTEGSEATDPESIRGRLLDLQGFYNRPFRATFDDLRIDDRIRGGVIHSNPIVDTFNVSELLEPIGSKSEGSKGNDR